MLGVGAALLAGCAPSAQGDADATEGRPALTIGCDNLYRWAGPYMQSRQVVAVMPESDIRTLADLRDKVVAVQVTTKLEEIFLSGEDKRIPLLGKVSSLEDRSLLYPSLGKGYVDAIAGHEASIL